MPKANEPRIVETFRAGDPVPEWMFLREPHSSKAKRGEMTFLVDVLAVELTDGTIFLLPASGKDLRREVTLIQLKDAPHNTICAGAQDVCILRDWWRAYGEGRTPPTPGGSDA